MLRSFSLGLLIAVSAQAFCQSALKLKLPDSGDFVPFSSKGPATKLPDPAAKGVNGAAILSVTSGDDTANVLDRSAGNIASTPAAKVKGAWAPKPTDYKAASQVTIHVEANAAPADSAEVELSDGTKRAPIIIDSSAKGDAVFFNVKDGKDTVTIHYRDAKGETRQTIQEFDLTQSRQDISPKWTVALADVPQSAPTTAAPATPASAPAPAPAKPAQPANPIGSFFVYIGALALACAVGYGIMRYFKSNPGPISAKLEQLGVQIPKAGTDPLTSAAPYAPDPIAKPAPPQKIILDGAAPDPLPSAAPIYTPTPAPVAAPMVSSPSLVTDQGVVLPLSDGDTTVGRDVGLGLSLAAETTVSRKHATLTKNGNDVTLQDLGSTNGTFVNGARVQTPVVLRSGDAVQFGSTKFVYRA